MRYPPLPCLQGAKRVDTWPNSGVTETENPVNPNISTSTLSVDPSPAVSEWWFEQNIGFSYYRLDRQSGHCTSAMLYRKSDSGPPPQGFPAAQVPVGSSSLGDTTVTLFDGSTRSAQAFGFNCTAGIADVQFRWRIPYPPPV